MYKKIAFLGCGKIGQKMLGYINTREDCSVSYIQDPFLDPEKVPGIPVIKDADAALLAETDLVIECATASVLKANAEQILKNADLLMFSVTAYQDAEFQANVEKWCQESGHHVYLPHGAILGIDGIYDSRPLLKRVVIETEKSPQSLGREDTERTVVYEGPTREACALYPRNVNVHASIALAGIGFDKTVSKIISDPAVDTNSHHIYVEGDGVRFELQITSLANGSITGAYTPVSAVGSLRRLLGDPSSFRFI